MKSKYLLQYLLILAFLSFFSSASAQWTNRYCKVDGFGHHVYLEGFELPVLNPGAIDPAPSPDGKQVAFASKGYLWLLNLDNGLAKRITFSAGIDSRPNWSPDGKQIVFIRDSGTDTEIRLWEAQENSERLLVNTEAIELDPIFNASGDAVYYSSADQGSLDIWEIILNSAEKNRITNSDELERLPVQVSENELIYLNKSGFSTDAISLMNLESGESHHLLVDNFTSQVSYSLHPDGRTLAYVFPNVDDYELRLKDIRTPGSSMLLTRSQGLPLCPKFSYDGKWIYYHENNEDERAELKRMSINGGQEESLSIKRWDWGEEMTRLSIRTRVEGASATTRLSIVDAKGHPIIPESGVVRTDGQNGDVFFYCSNEVEVAAPIGELTIKATQGFETRPEIRTIAVGKGANLTNIDLERIWDASENDWYSGDLHFHLNYGGVYHLDPMDIKPDLRGEALDLGYPLLANLHNRFLEQDLWGWKDTDAPFIFFGQEVRSHFLGHLGLIGTSELYWPWVWGPAYDIYGRDDRANASPLEFAHKHNGLGSYVHPVSVRDPFTEEGAGRVPIELVVDCVLGKADLIELGCLWTDEIGTGALWHEILNLGIPLNISAGSDVMNDYYHTMAVGASRVYVKESGSLSERSFLQALIEGKSFVSTGPMIEFTVDGQGPGEVISKDRSKRKFTLEVHSPIAYEQVEIFINGEVVWSKKGSKTIGSKKYKGKLSIPEGGWITARVSGGASAWPLMESYPFAESSPVWISEKGSSMDIPRRNAARKLLTILDVSEQDLKEGYQDAPIPILLEEFKKARTKLEFLAK